MLIPCDLLKTLKNRISAVGSPLLVGITGAMAVGKSSFSRALCERLNQEMGPQTASLVALDGFLYSNAELTRRCLMTQKGQPSSFRLDDCRSFIRQLQSASVGPLRVPYYDQTLKDIHPSRFQDIKGAKIYILEGVALLFYLAKSEVLWDQLILLDKELEEIYLQFYARFEQSFTLLQRKANSYFSDPAWQDSQERDKRIKQIWRTIHVPFYKEWVLPAKEKVDWLVRLK